MKVRGQTIKASSKEEMKKGVRATNGSVPANGRSNKPSSPVKKTPSSIYGATNAMLKSQQKANKQKINQRRNKTLGQLKDIVTMNRASLDSMSGGRASNTANNILRSNYADNAYAQRLYAKQMRLDNKENTNDTRISMYKDLAMQKYNNQREDFVNTAPTLYGTKKGYDNAIKDAEKKGQDWKVPYLLAGKNGLADAKDAAGFMVYAPEKTGGGSKSGGSKGGGSKSGGSGGGSKGGTGSGTSVYGIDSTTTGGKGKGKAKPDVTTKSEKLLSASVANLKYKKIKKTSEFVNVKVDGETKNYRIYLDPQGNQYVVHKGQYRMVIE